MITSRSVAVLLALVCSLSHSSCSNRASSEETLPSGEVVRSDDAESRPASSPADQAATLTETFRATGHFRSSRTAAIDVLGPPPRMLHTPVENIHVTGRMDTLVSLRYEALAVTYWVPGEPTARDILVDVAILPPWPLDVGVPESAGRRDLVHLWGEPAFATSSADTVILNWTVWTDDAEEYLQAYLVENEIRKLRWSFYID